MLGVANALFLKLNVKLKKKKETILYSKFNKDFKNGPHKKKS